MSKFASDLQASRSPFAIALLANAGFVAGLLVAFAVFYFADSEAMRAIAIIPLFGGIAIGYGVGLLSICPSCGKLPFIKHWSDDYFVTSAARRRFWPERTCSRCGYDLTQHSYDA